MVLFPYFPVLFPLATFSFFSRSLTPFLLCSIDIGQLTAANPVNLFAERDWNREGPPKGVTKKENRNGRMNDGGKIHELHCFGKQFIWNDIALISHSTFLPWIFDNLFEIQSRMALWLRRWDEVKPQMSTASVSFLLSFCLNSDLFSPVEMSQWIKTSN